MARNAQNEANRAIANMGNYVGARCSYFPLLRLSALPRMQQFSKLEVSEVCFP